MWTGVEGRETAQTGTESKSQAKLGTVGQCGCWSDERLKHYKLKKVERKLSVREGKREFQQMHTRARARACFESHHPPTIKLTGVIQSKTLNIEMFVLMGLRK